LGERSKYESLYIIRICSIYEISYKKNPWRQPTKKKKIGKNLSPRNRKACHNTSTALWKRVAEIGTQSATKSSRKTLHEFSSHIPPKTPKRNISRLTNEMLHTDITVRAQGARVSCPHAREAPNSHQNSQAENCV
jgi:hypothetical protein